MAARLMARAAPLVLWLVLASCAHNPPAGPQVRFDRASPYARVLVVDEGPHRFLRFDDVDGDDQSMIALDDPHDVPMDYIRGALLAAILAEPVERALVIGLGGGTFPMLLRRLEPEATVEAVEIDPVVVEVAQAFFGLTPDPRLVIHTGDGAAFIAETPRAYDVILLDAYDAGGIPAPLGTTAFFAAVRARCSPRGVVVLNLSVAPDVEARLAARFAEVFPHRGCLRTEDEANLLVFGLPAPVSPDEVHEVGARVEHLLDLDLLTPRWRVCP